RGSSTGGSRARTRFGGVGAAFFQRQLRPIFPTMRKYFITGLLILVPLAITVWVLNLIIGTMDQSLLLLPESWRPEAIVGFHIPGLGTILTLLIIFLTGLAARNFIGRQIVSLWEGILTRIPVVKSIYSSVKQVSDTLFSSSGNAFRKAVLIQYPRQGSWTIAFLTGVPGGEVRNHLHGDFISVYVPTTPNPTSGFFLMLPRADSIELDMSVDEALKYIVSMGVVAPEAQADKKIITASAAPHN
ncbi:hypothetical protein PMI40_04765, partial [Herbaspirillum sp. YR522]